MAPLLTDAAVKYAWRQLARRAGVEGGDPSGNGFEALNLAVHYGRPDQVMAEPPAIVVVPCGDDALRALLDRPANSLAWLPVERFLPEGGQLLVDDPVPILLSAAGCQQDESVVESDGRLLFYVDVVATTWFMLSRWEETVIRDHDEHGRFRGEASVACRQGFLDRPVVDEYGLILRQWLKKLLPGWQPRPRSWALKLTSDVDHVKDYSSLGMALRVLARDLLKRRDVTEAWRTAKSATTQAIAPARTSNFRNIYFLAQLSRRHGFQHSAFYFMTAGPGLFGSDYQITSSLIRRCIADLREQGFEIGLHPGYNTLNNREQLALEKTRMDALLGETDYGGRQHYLRFQVPYTWQDWEQVGLAYDSTAGYPDYEGFRCGTCHPFRPFDVQQDRELALWEYPPIVMDQTLRAYRGLTPDQAGARIIEMAKRCKQVEGVFTMLWHNTSLEGKWRLWREMYIETVAALGGLR